MQAQQALLPTQEYENALFAAERKAEAGLEAWRQPLAPCPACAQRGESTGALHSASVDFNFKCCHFGSSGNRQVLACFMIWECAHVALEGTTPCKLQPLDPRFEGAEARTRHLQDPYREARCECNLAPCVQYVLEA